MPEALRTKIFEAGVQARFQAGQMIHLEGDKDASLSIIIEGSVIISRTKADGEEIVVAVLRPGESYGEHPLFADIPRTHDATAGSDVTIREISKVRFFRLMDDDPEIRNHALKALTFRVIRALDLLDDERRHDVTFRLAKFLIEHCDTGSGHHSLQLTQSFIAGSLDVSRMSVSSSLKKLKRMGLAKTSYGQIHIPNVERLKSWLRS